MRADRESGVLYPVPLTSNSPNNPNIPGVSGMSEVVKGYYKRQHIKDKLIRLLRRIETSITHNNP